MRGKDAAYLAVAVVLGVAWIVVGLRVWPALVPLPASTPPPAPLAAGVDVPRAPGTIAFARRGDIVLVREGRMAPLTSGGGRRDPALTRDGSRIAYTVAGSIEGRRVSDGANVIAHLAYESVVARAVSGGAEQVLVDGLQRRDPGGRHEVEFQSQPAWSADRAQLAFISDGGAGADLQVLTIASKRLAALTNGALLADPAWSPEGKTIAATSYLGGSASVVLVPADGRAQARRLEVARVGSPYRPSYSLDGRWLLTTLRTERGNDLLAVELQSGRAVALTNDGRSWGGVFSPDGDHAAFFRATDASVEVFVMELGDALSGGVARSAWQLSRGGADGASRLSWSR